MFTDHNCNKHNYYVVYVSTCATCVLLTAGNVQVVGGNNGVYSLGSLIRCGRVSLFVDNPVGCVTRLW